MIKSLNNKVLDDLDLHILQQLQADARLPISEIGKRIGLTGPAVAERIKKMEENGIITGYTVIIDHDKIGFTVNAFITLKSSMQHDAAVNRIKAIPEILECYNITGNNCIILKVAAATTKKLEIIIGKLQLIGETNTSIILSPSFEKRGINLEKTAKSG